MSLPGNDTVREQILVKIRDLLAGLSWVGGVAAVTEAIELATPFDQSKAFILYAADSDLSKEQEGIRDGFNVEAFSFDLRLETYIAESLFLTPTAPDSAQRTGARIHGLLLAALLAPGSLGGLAMRVDTVGGGGIGWKSPEERVVIVESVFQIHYRIRRGSPEVVV